MTCADCGRTVTARSGYCDNCGAWSLDLGFTTEDAAATEIPVYPTQAQAQAYPRMQRPADENVAVPPTFLNAPPPRPGTIPGQPVAGTPSPEFSAPPPAAFVPPAYVPPAYEAPTFSAPSPAYAPPSQPRSFAPPQQQQPQSFAPPQAFAPPRYQPFAAPAPTFGAPAPTFSAPAPTFSAPAPTFSAPAPTFSAPETVAATVPPEGFAGAPTTVGKPAPSEVFPTQPPEFEHGGEAPTMGVSLLWGPPRATDRVEAPAPFIDPETDNDDWEETRMVRRDHRTRLWALTLPDESVEIILKTAIVGRASSPTPEWPGASLISVADPSRSVSKNHAAFSDTAGILTVEDLYSTNGVVVTRADGIEFTLRPGGKAELDEGSTVELGEYLVRVHKLAGPDLAI